MKHDAGVQFDLERFVEAQEGVYGSAREELRRGRKTSHWMWFVFPQLEGLGRSEMSQRYAIGSLAEAQAYVAHPILGPRLRESAGILVATTGRTAEEIFRPLDTMKLHSSMTLFHIADPDEPLFGQVLDRYFDGLADQTTLSLLARRF